jgi:cytochrome oxidase assembly protein ShyY1
MCHVSEVPRHFSQPEARVNIVLQPGYFLPPNNPAKGEWRWFDVEGMKSHIAEQLGKEYCFDSNVMFEVLPKGQFFRGAQQKSLNEYAKFYVEPATHVSYAVTWFSLSALGVVMTRKLLTKGR